MQAWKELWRACAQSVVSSGLTPGVWSNSEYVEEEIFTKNDEWPSSVVFERRFQAGHGFQFLSSMLELACSQSLPAMRIMVEDPSSDSGKNLNVVISTVLTVDFQRRQDFDWWDEQGDPALFVENTSDHVIACVVLSDGRIALMDVFLLRVSANDDIVSGSSNIYVHKDFPGLFAFVRRTTGGICYWVQRMRCEDSEHGGIKYLTFFRWLPRPCCLFSPFEVFSPSLIDLGTNDMNQIVLRSDFDAIVLNVQAALMGDSGSTDGPLCCQPDWYGWYCQICGTQR